MPLIEPALSPRVYSSRLASKGSTFFKKATKQWILWHRSIQQELSTGNTWVARTDITAFFEHIDHGIILAELSSAGAAHSAISALRSFLSAWSRTPGRGLPQGPNASRALGNFYLAAIDRVLLNEGFNYWRYMDDIMIVAQSKAGAATGMRHLESLCRKRGLALSAHKTQLLTGAAAISTGASPERDAAQYLVDSRQEREARRTLRKILMKSIKADGQVDVGAATFSLWRLAQLVDQWPVSRAGPRQSSSLMS
jgi:hypothetical protein